MPVEAMVCSFMHLACEQRKRELNIVSTSKKKVITVHDHVILEKSNGVCIVFYLDYWSIFLQLYSEVLSDKMKPRVKEALESSHQDDLRTAIELAWKFVTLPNPLIVCQPKKYDSRIHDKEAVYWDNQADECELIYLRSVLY